MILPDYNPDARCPKCGYDLVKTKYHPVRYFDGYSFPPTRIYPPTPEHLLRQCVRCGYHWRENVISVREINVKSEAE